MPFVQPGEPGAEQPSQPARLIVEPDKILALKAGLEARRDKIQRFIDDKGDNLRYIPPPGDDPRSKLAVAQLGANGQSALDAAQGFADALTGIVEQLEETARAYGLMEEHNTDQFRQEPQ